MGANRPIRANERFAKIRTRAIVGFPESRRPTCEKSRAGGEREGVFPGRNRPQPIEKALSSEEKSILLLLRRPLLLLRPAWKLLRSAWKLLRPILLLLRGPGSPAGA
jgi:hypothetical protein